MRDLVHSELADVLHAQHRPFVRVSHAQANVVKGKPIHIARIEAPRREAMHAIAGLYYRRLR